jgi:SAM-dependent methyltransferase
LVDFPSRCYTKKQALSRLLFVFYSHYEGKFMPADYRVLATIHDELNFGNFARQMTGHLLDFAQRDHWMGRQILDLGCGSGESLRWLSQKGYIVTGVDQSQDMLNLARSKVQTQGGSVRILNKAFKQIDEVQDMDLVISLDTLHELGSLRELEDVFRQVHGFLKPERLFIFDLYTIEGLVKRSEDPSTLEVDNKDLTIITRNNYDFERNVQRRDYIVLRREGDGWQRQDAYRELRAYPIQGITALLGRCGFEVRHVLNSELNNYQAADSTPRVIIMAIKK